MNKKIRTRWTAALRSSDFKQGIGQLRTGDNYCCLGVLCDLYRRDSTTPKDARWNNGIFYPGDDIVPEAGLLPDAVMKWAGLLSLDPNLGAAESAVTMNDGGSGFAQIADAIEKYL